MAEISFLHEMFLCHISCKGEIPAVPFYSLMCSYSYTISFLRVYIWNVKPDDSCLVLSKHVLFDLIKSNV
jgi:hypothetical protein